MWCRCVHTLLASLTPFAVFVECTLALVILQLQENLSLHRVDYTVSVFSMMAATNECNQSVIKYALFV